MFGVKNLGKAVRELVHYLDKNGVDKKHINAFLASFNGIADVGNNAVHIAEKIESHLPSQKMISKIASNLESGIKLCTDGVNIAEKIETHLPSKKTIHKMTNALETSVKLFKRNETSIGSALNGVSSLGQLAKEVQPKLPMFLDAAKYIPDATQTLSKLEKTAGIACSNFKNLFSASVFGIGAATVFMIGKLILDYKLGCTVEQMGSNITKELKDMHEQLAIQTAIQRQILFQEYASNYLSYMNKIQNDSFKNLEGDDQKLCIQVFKQCKVDLSKEMCYQTLDANFMNYVRNKIHSVMEILHKTKETSVKLENRITGRSNWNRMIDYIIDNKGKEPEFNPKDICFADLLCDHPKIEEISTELFNRLKSPSVKLLNSILYSNRQIDVFKKSAYYIIHSLTASNFTIDKDCHPALKDFLTEHERFKNDFKSLCKERSLDTPEIEININMVFGIVVFKTYFRAFTEIKDQYNQSWGRISTDDSLLQFLEKNKISLPNSEVELHFKTQPQHLEETQNNRTKKDKKRKKISNTKKSSGQSNHTLSDGNCAINALALGIYSLVVQEKISIDTVSEKLKIPLRKFKNLFYNRFKHINNRIRFQKLCSPELRKLAILLITNNFIYYKDTYENAFFSAFNDYILGSLDEVFCVHSFIRVKFDEIKSLYFPNVTKEATEQLKVWWDSFGKNAYFSELSKTANGAEDSARWCSDVEIDALACNFGITVKNVKNNLTQILGVGYGVVNDLSENEIAFLQALKIGLRYRDTFRIEIEEKTRLEQLLNLPLTELEVIFFTGQKTAILNHKNNPTISNSNLEQICKRLSALGAFEMSTANNQFRYVNDIDLRNLILPANEQLKNKVIRSYINPSSFKIQLQGNHWSFIPTEMPMFLNQFKNKRRSSRKSTPIHGYSFDKQGNPIHREEIVSSNNQDRDKMKKKQKK